MTRVAMQRGCAFTHDRQFAIVHRNSRYQPEQPAWIARRHFTVLAYSPALAKLNCSFDADRRMLTVKYNQLSADIFVDSKNAENQLNEVLHELSIDSQPGPYSLAEVDGTALTDSPEPLISLMNTRSLDQLAAATGFSIDAIRFRGNLWFEGETPWEERQWIGKVFSVGRAQVRVVEEIVRCSAIDVDPISGRKDIALLNRLGGLYGHTCFGVLAEVLQSGQVTVGDNFTEFQSQPYGPPGI